VLRQFLSHRVSEGDSGPVCSGAWADVSAQILTPTEIFFNDYRRVVYSLKTGDGGLYVSQFNPMSPDFDLEILSSKEKDVAVRSITTHVACMIKPRMQTLLCLLEWISFEYCCGAVRVKKVPTAHANSRNANLSSDPYGTKAIVLVHDVDS